MANGPYTITDPRSASVTTQTDGAPDRTADAKALHEQMFPNTRPAMPPPKGQLYGADATMQHEYHQHTDSLRSVIGMSEPETLRSQRAFSTMLDEVGLDALSIGRPLYKAVVAADVAAKRGTGPSEEQRQQWWEESRRRLNAMGPDMGPRYQKFMKSHPALTALANKVGTQPDLVELIATKHIRAKGYR